MATKVKNTVSLHTSQGDVIVTKGKLVLIPIDRPMDTEDHIYLIHSGQPRNVYAVRIDNNWYKPIIISKTQKWNPGDKIHTSNIPIETVKDIIPYGEQKGYETLTFVEGNGNQYKPVEIFGKILALPQNFSHKHLRTIVDGKLKDGDELYVECTSEEYNKTYIPEIKLSTYENCVTLHKVEKAPIELLNEMVENYIQQRPNEFKELIRRYIRDYKDVSIEFYGEKMYTKQELEEFCKKAFDREIKGIPFQTIKFSEWKKRNLE